MLNLNNGEPPTRLGKTGLFLACLAFGFIFFAAIGGIGVLLIFCIEWLRLHAAEVNWAAILLVALYIFMSSWMGINLYKGISKEM